MTGDVAAAAVAAYAAGLCVLPPAEDGSKVPIAPGAPWKQYQRRRPGREQLRHWYEGRGRTGIALVCGAVSGNLTALDFDDRATYDAFLAEADRAGLADPLERVRAGYEEDTPGDGVHLLYSCAEVRPNTALAKRPTRPEERRDEHDRFRPLLESRGEGGVIIVAPSNGPVHPTGGAYRLRRGGFATIATISPEEQGDLFDFARTFDRTPAPPPREPRPPGPGAGDRPGDDFAARTGWAEILEPHGWAFVYRRGDEDYWRRPGKTEGVSATTNYRGSDLLKVFTSSTAFEQGSTYTKYGAYAVLEHGGDFAAAARALAARGYGTPPVAPRPTPSADPWPALDPAALHGLAGDVVRALGPHTEGDPVAVLVNFLAMVGSSVGSAPYCAVGEARHGANLFAVHVGATAKARKGTAHADTLGIVRRADPTWAGERITGGLASGEGLVWPIRDPIEGTKKGVPVVLDPGVFDKRLLVVEEEFSSVAKVAGREGNTLSEQLRKAWDGRTLGVMTRNSPLRASAPHVSVLAHVTKDELLRVFDSTDAANGFGNRFLWTCVRRSKLLAEGGRLPEAEAAALARRTADALAAARKRNELRRDGEAKALWAEVYPELSAAKPGLLGALLARAEAHVLRLSLVYALLDRADAIGAGHLYAALALWDYCEASARWVFGDATGDPVADRVLAVLRANGPMAQGEVVDLFGRHVGAARIGRAQEALVAAGLVRVTREESGGRPRTVWSAV